MPRKSPPKRKPAPANAPKALRFLGHADHYVQGVAQSDLEVVEAPVHAHQVTPERALELLESGLYVAKAPKTGEEVKSNG